MDLPVLNAQGNSIFLLGHVYDSHYQRAKWMAEKLIQQRLSTESKPTACGLYESDFEQQLWFFQHAVGGPFWTCRTKVMIFINGAYIGDDESLLVFLNKNFTIPTSVPSLEHADISEAASRGLLDLIGRDKQSQYVYLDIGLDSCYIGSLVIRLYSDVCPVTCQRFIEYVCTRREEKEDFGKPGYVGTKVHRLSLPSFLQCGNIRETTPPFPDESFEVVHDRRGVVSFCNHGPNTNKDQFIISLQANPWMDRKYVAFGQVVEGMKVLDWIEAVPTFYESPEQDIEILECGRLPLKTSSGESSAGRLRSGYVLPSIPSIPSLPLYDLQSIANESDMTADMKKMVVDKLTDHPFPIKDEVHPDDTRSDHLLLERYQQGLYTMPREYQAYVRHMKKTFPKTTQGLDHSCEPNTALGEVACQPYQKGTSQVRSDLYVGLRHKIMAAIQSKSKISDIHLDIKLIVRDALRQQMMSKALIKSRHVTGLLKTPCDRAKEKELADRRQYYSLNKDNNILNSGLDESQLRDKTDDELVRLFDDVTMCSDDTQFDDDTKFDVMHGVDSLEFGKEFDDGESEAGSTDTVG